MSTPWCELATRLGPNIYSRCFVACWTSRASESQRHQDWSWHPSSLLRTGSLALSNEHCAQWSMEHRRALPMSSEVSGRLRPVGGPLAFAAARAVGHRISSRMRSPACCTRRQPKHLCERRPPRRPRGVELRPVRTRPPRWLWH